MTEKSSDAIGYNSKPPTPHYYNMVHLLCLASILSFVIGKTCSCYALAFIRNVDTLVFQTYMKDHVCRPLPRRPRSCTRLWQNLDEENDSLLAEPIFPSNETDGVNMCLVARKSNHEWERYLLESKPPSRNPFGTIKDPFWEQIRQDARDSLSDHTEQAAGPQLYQGIISHRSLLTAICTIVAHEIENDLVGATELRDLFLDNLTPDDEYAIRLDLQAVATRSPSTETAMEALLFHKGFHSLVCYRVGHRLWLAGRKGLAYYMQSMVSRVYSSDIHPACLMGHGVYLRGAGCGIVIGETATIGNDVSILQGCTLGGTGKENGDRHPKVHDGVILQDGSTVLGNIIVGEGSIVTAKSIVTKPVDPLSIVSGVPAKVVGSRNVLGPNAKEDFELDDMTEHLALKYMPHWQNIALEQEAEKDHDRSQAL